MPRNRLMLGIVCLLVAAGALAAIWLLRPRPDSVMGVTVRVTAEDGSVEAREARALFASRRRERPIATVEVDLSRWAGKLVRFNIEGALRGRRDGAGPAGSVGCAATIGGAAGERPVEFVGWVNDGQERVHLGALGPASFRGPERQGHTFVYGPENRLWNVISVRPRERLRLYFTPILTGDLDHAQEAYVPRAPQPWRPPQAAHKAKGARPPDVYIYLIDALRPDHLGCYGYDRPTSPVIDRFAAGAVVYEHAQATATWTRPSVSSFFTGLYPLAHGVEHLDSDKLDEWPVTIAEALQEADYRTVYVCTNGHASGHYGFLQGVDAYTYKNDESADWANRQLGALMADEKADQPVFAYVHTIEPHEPYTPNPATLRLFDRGFRGQRYATAAALAQAPERYPGLSQEETQHLVDLYDADVRDADTAFGEFLDLLKRTGRLENSLIIVLADHGEALGEHDTLRHGTTLNVEQMRPPLIIRYPGGRHGGARVRTPVSLVDLYPTVMAATAVTPTLSYALAGRDLAGLAASPSSAPGVPIFAEVSKMSNNRLDLVGVIDEDGYKRVFDMSVKPGAMVTKSSIGLWDTRSDPKEQRDLTRALPLRAAYDEVLTARYLVTQRWWRGPASTGTTPSAPLSPGMRKSLQALGYLK